MEYSIKKIGYIGIIFLVVLFTAITVHAQNEENTEELIQEEVEVGVVENTEFDSNNVDDGGFVAENEQFPVSEENIGDIAEESTQEVVEEIPGMVKVKEKNAKKGLIIIQEFDAAVKIMQNVSGRLSNKMIEMEEGGAQIGTAKNLVKQGNNALRNSFSEVKGVKEKINGYVSAGLYPEGEIERIKSQLNQAANGINTAKTSFMEALESLQSVTQ